MKLLLPVATHLRVACLFICLLIIGVLPGKSQTGNNCNPSINIASLAHTLCPGNTPSFAATAINAGTNPVYQWKKNGVPVGTNSATYSGALSVNDEIVCELRTTSCSNNVTVISNRFKLETNNYREPEVTTTADRLSICNGQMVTFTATNKSGSANPTFLWFVNGTPVEGSNNPVFTASSLPDGARVECMMTVPQCGGNGSSSTGSTKDYSEPITISHSTALDPEVEISTPASVVCKGSAAEFTAAASDAGSNPIYEWMINGIKVGGSTTTFTTTGLNDGDVVSCKLIINPAANCGQTGEAVSNTIKVKVVEGVLPAVSITASDEEICEGTPVTFSANAENAGENKTYQWLVNGQEAGTNAPVFTSNLLKDGDKVVCRLTAVTGCGNTSVLSNVMSLVVKEMPRIHIDPDTVTIWAGEKALLTASSSGDLASFTWFPSGKLQNPESLTPSTIALPSNTLFQLTAVSSRGCTESKQVWVKVLQRLFIPNGFTPNYDGLNDVFRLPPDVPLVLKDFSIYDRWGNKVFSTKEVNQGWNGLFKGKEAPTGAYVYVVKGLYVNEEVELKGSLMLIR